VGDIMSESMGGIISECPGDFIGIGRLEGIADWGSLKDRSSVNLREDYQYVVNSLADAGYRKIYRVNLTRPPFQLPVVKVLVPGLEFNERLF
jgi:ribosomal protein S12 methylthiotransferase accessory factor YcaO